MRKSRRDSIVDAVALASIALALLVILLEDGIRGIATLFASVLFAGVVIFLAALFLAHARESEE